LFCFTSILEITFRLNLFVHPAAAADDDDDLQLSCVDGDVFGLNSDKDSRTTEKRKQRSKRLPSRKVR